METRSLLRKFRKSAGLLGVVLLAYSAGYTRAFLVENTSIIEEGRAATRVLFSLSGLPTWIGLLGFAGMGLTFLYVIAYPFSGRIGSTDDGRS